jgi:transposase-like protein
MTMAERAKLAAKATNAPYYERAETLRRLLEEGEHIKRAAWKAGMAHRTARRWRQRFRGQ